MNKYHHKKTLFPPKRGDRGGCGQLSLDVTVRTDTSQAKIEPVIGSNGSQNNDFQKDILYPFKTSILEYKNEIQNEKE